MTSENSHPTPPVDSEPWDALARYLCGESPPGEVEAVRRWLDAVPARAELLAALERATRRLQFRAPADLDVEAALRRVRARQDEPALRLLPGGARPAPEPGRARWRTISIRIAAAVALLVGGTLVWRATHETAVDVATVAARTYTTRVGQTESVRLPDGSRVLLGAASRLVVAAGFGEPAREVEFTGEALFDVRHDAAHPFHVRAGSATIQDVGTTFTVHSDGGEGVRVVVTSGAVLLKAAGARSGAGVTLHAGDRGTLSPDGRAVAERDAATEADLAWTSGQLVFEDAPLSRVSADLRRWYGVELDVSDPALAGRHLTASFKGERVDQVLNVIALALGARVERHGDRAVLRAAAGGVTPR